MEKVNKNYFLKRMPMIFKRLQFR